MSTSSPKWSRKSARRASGARNAALAAVAAAFVAACSGGGGDAGIGLPPDQGPIAWGPATVVDTRTEAAGNVVAAMDAASGATLAWFQSNGAAHAIFAARNTSGTTWSAPIEIASSPNVFTDLRISVAGLETLLLWGDTTPGAAALKTSSLVSGVWTAQRTVAGGLISSLAVASNASGNAVAVWVENSPPALPRVYGSFRDASGDWVAKQPIQVATNLSGADPAVALDPSGNALVLWYEYPQGGGARIVSRTLDSLTGTLGPVLDVSAFGVNAVRPQVAGIGTAAFIGVWEQTEGTVSAIRSRRFSGGAWAPVGSRLVYLDAGGNATLVRITGVVGDSVVAVWQQDTSAGRRTVRSSRYSVATDLWGASKEASAVTSTINDEHAVARFSNGDVVGVWRQYTTTPTDLMYGLLPNSPTDASWSAAKSIDSAQFVGGQPAVATQAGSAVVAWRRQVGTTFDVVARVFRP